MTIAIWSFSQLLSMAAAILYTLSKSKNTNLLHLAQFLHLKKEKDSYTENKASMLSIHLLVH